MRILFITHNRLGDAILSTGLLAHLIARHPDAAVVVACGPVAAPVFEACPNLERLIVLRKAPRLGHWRALWGATIGTKWDLVVDLRASAIAWLLRAKARRVLRGGAPDRHKVEALGALFGLDSPPSPHLWRSEEDQAAARALLPTGGPVLGLGPTANWIGKRWPAERFAELALALTAPNGPLPGAPIAVFGAGHEAEMARPLLARLQGEREAVWLGGAPLMALADALAHCALYVGNDSGLMHLAAAAGAPTLGLFGPSREAVYAPWGETCATVRGPRSYEQIRHGPGYDHRLAVSWMEDLEVGAVHRAAAELLARDAPGRTALP